MESIVRKRAFEGMQPEMFDALIQTFTLFFGVYSAFRSRCQYFTTPTSDPEARKMWDSVAR